MPVMLTAKSKIDHDQAKALVEQIRKVPHVVSCKLWDKSGKLVIHVDFAKFDGKKPTPGVGVRFSIDCGNMNIVQEDNWAGSETKDRIQDSLVKVKELRDKLTNTKSLRMVAMADKKIDLLKLIRSTASDINKESAARIGDLIEGDTPDLEYLGQLISALSKHYAYMMSKASKSVTAGPPSVTGEWETIVDAYSKAVLGSGLADAVDEAKTEGLIERAPWGPGEDILDYISTDSIDKVRSQVESFLEKLRKDKVLVDYQMFAEDTGEGADTYGHYLAMQQMGHGVGLQDYSYDTTLPKTHTEVYGYPSEEEPVILYVAGTFDFEIPYDDMV